MNFEEIVNAHEGLSRHEKTPFGLVLKEQIEKKYFYVLSVRNDLADRPDFRSCLETDMKFALAAKCKQQLRYQTGNSEKGGLRLELENGQFHTFAQVLENNPAIVAKSGFVDGVVGELFDALTFLHEHSVYHVCLSPQNLFIRKGDEMPMMLLHGSHFTRLTDFPACLFAEQGEFVAPEVRDGQAPTQRSDVYSLGRFIAWLYSQGDMPYEYKQVVEKATREDPAKRFASIAEMRAMLRKMRSRKFSFYAFLGAMVLVLVCVWSYFEFMPSTDDIEFVDPVPKETVEDEFGNTFDPEDSLAIYAGGDSLDTLNSEERRMMEAYMQKAEEIYRKQLSTEADRILSKIYNKEQLTSSEKNFMASSTAVRDELMKVQNELATRAGISDERAGRIATEVLDVITAEKQKQLYNYTDPRRQKPSEDDITNNNKNNVNKNVNKK